MGRRKAVFTEFRSAVAGGFDVEHAGQGEGGAEEFEPGAAFAEEDDAETGGGDGEEIGEGRELRGFEIAKQPVVKEVGERGTEERHVKHAGPGLPMDGAPVVERAENEGAIDGDGKDEERSNDEIPCGHSEGVVAGGDAFAENDVGGETERTGQGDEIAGKCGRAAVDAGVGGQVRYQ